MTQCEKASIQAVRCNQQVHIDEGSSYNIWDYNTLDRACKVFLLDFCDGRAERLGWTARVVVSMGGGNNVLNLQNLALTVCYGILCSTILVQKSPVPHFKEQKWDRTFLEGYNDYRGVAQLGSARRSGRRGRRFESSLPDHCNLRKSRYRPFGL